MSTESAHDDASWQLKATPAAIKSVLEMLPCAVALWMPNHFLCFLNYHVTQLTGFSDRDFQLDPSLWVSRIDPRDRGVFSTALRRLQAGEKMVSCEYRFYPRGDGREIWLRDVSVLRQNPHGEIESLISNYTDISDLKAGHSNGEWTQNAGNIVAVISALVHEIQNNLQAIGMGLDLLRMEGRAKGEYRPVADSVERMNKAILELREYLLPPEARFSAENPAIILDDVVRHMEKELRHQGVRLRMVRHSPLPLVRLDLKQFRSALERVLEFSRALLPQGGELEVEAGLQEIDGQRYVELQIASSSAICLDVEEKDVFRPFLRVNNRQVGLSLTLAQQILRRHHGTIHFQKENPLRGLFTILLEVRSDH